MKRPECFKLSPSLVLHTDGSFVQQRGDAKDVAVTDVRYGAFDDALAAFQTPVALEGVPRSLALHPVEHFHLSELGYQHQLGKEMAWSLKMSQGSTWKDSNCNWPHRIDERVRVLDVADGRVVR